MIERQSQIRTNKLSARLPPNPTSPRSPHRFSPDVVVVTVDVGIAGATIPEIGGGSDSHNDAIQCSFTQNLKF